MEGRNGLTGECVKQADRIGAHIKERGSVVAHLVVENLVLLTMRKKPVHVPRMEDGVTGVNGPVVAVELVEVKKEQGAVIIHYLVREELNAKVQMRKRDAVHWTVAGVTILPPLSATRTPAHRYGAVNPTILHQAVMGPSVMGPATRLETAQFTVSGESGSSFQLATMKRPNSSLFVTKL